ncbi:MAG: PHP domain-containing protein [Rhodothermales bacterium]|nr:PHP domain-containing protein [Rhodothermales bacterium]
MRPPTSGARADLHTHTTCSDGRLSPPGLVEKAHLRGLAALAITDHDAVAGYALARPTAERLGVRLVPGVELSAFVDGADVHLLGYGFDPEDAALKAHLARYRAERLERAHEIVAKLGALGRIVEIERVLALAGQGTVGRPHVARALVEAGHVETVQEAFERYLADGAAAFVPKGTASPEELAGLLHAAGGLCVLAHPGHWTSQRTVARLVEAGLDGIETVHPAHDANLVAYWKRTAERYGLIQTGGSDYHGFREGEEERFGRYTVPVERLARLRRAA